MSKMDGTAVYQVFYPDALPQADLLGLWQPGGLDGSFSIGGEMPGVVWRVNLPEDPGESARLLNTQTVALRQTALALEAAGPLLGRDLQQADCKRQHRLQKVRQPLTSPVQAPGVMTWSPRRSAMTRAACLSTCAMS